MYTRKTTAQIAIMRRAGRVVAEMHEACALAARPGATTSQIDSVARDVLDRRNARSNFLGYHGFPAVICASPNEVIVHGIPDGRVLSEGDILSIDCGAIIDGWHADAALTIPIGEIDEESKRLIDATRASLEAAIAAMKVGVNLGRLGGAVEDVVEAAGFAVVRDYVGHGIGRAMHEDPEVPNFRNGSGHRLKLKSGIVLAIEPMVNTGTDETRLLDDGWTVVTADGGRSAHFEHTIALTDNGPEVLTLP